MDWFYLSRHADYITCGKAKSGIHLKTHCQGAILVKFQSVFRAEAR